MPNPFQKSVQNYVSKIKLIPQKQIQFHSSSFSSSKRWILKHIKKSHSTLKGKQRPRNKKHDDKSENKQDEAAKLSDVDRFLFENFKSLYFNNDGEGFEKEKNLNPKYDDEDDHPDSSDDDDDDHDHDDNNDCESDDDDGRYDENRPQTPTSETVTTLFESPKFTDIPLDLCESKLFVRSSSISHSVTRRTRSVSNVSMMTTTTISNGMTSESCARIEFGSNSNSYQKSKGVVDVEVPDDCIVVLRCSPSPQNDFQRSMREMIDMRLQENKEVDWEFMKELLFCFLNLNEPKSFQFILSAFVDLVIEVRENEGKSLTKPQSFLLGSKNKIVEK